MSYFALSVLFAVSVFFVQSKSIARGRLGKLCLALAVSVAGAGPTAFAQAKASTTTTLAVTSGGGAVTTVAAGSVVTLTATVKSSGTAVTVGQVNFCDATAKYCTDVHVVGTAQLTSAGTAVVKFRPGIGAHSYKAVFAGTNAAAASASSSSSLTVTGTPVTYATSTAIAKSGSWGNYSLTATATETGGKPVPTGTASFLDTSNGNAVLATADFGADTTDVNWINSQTPRVGFRPNSVAVGDFNGDGIPDLAVANNSGGSVSILLGKGDGTFTATATTLTVASANYLAVADFNGDGKLDLAVTSYSSAGTLSVFLGNGDGTFSQTATSPTVVQYASAITVGDFNGDGIPDLALSAPFTGAYSILIGKGDGTFTATQVTVSQQGCYGDVAAGDFNGDGKLDLVLTSSCEYNNGNPIVILLGNGDGTFVAGSTPQSVDEPGDVVVGDFNGDGKPDLAVAVAAGSATLDVFLNNGDGTFTVHYFGTSIPQHGSTLAIGDVSGDGVADLVLPNVYNNNLWVFIGNGGGSFSQSGISPATGSIPLFAAVGDFNGDGSGDVVTANNFDSTVTVLLSQPMQTTTATAESVVIASPGDHLVDASYSGDPNYKTSVSGTTSLWGVPSASVTTLALTSGGAPASTVAAGSTVTLTATVKVGAKLLTAGEVDFCDPSVATCTDIHLIGRAQLTSAGTAAYKFVPGVGTHSYKAVLEQNGGGLTSTSGTVTLTVNAKAGVTYPTTTAIAQSGEVGNYTLTSTVTETGGTAPPTGTVSFLDTSYANALVGKATLGTATPGLAWVNPQTPATGAGPIASVAADFNGDGKVDLAVVNQPADTITILLGNGDGTFTPAATSPAGGPQPIAIATADFNGDGLPDLVVANSDSAGTMTILLDKGDGSFTPVGASLTVGQPVWSMTVGDFTSDGIQDIVVSSYAQNGLTVFQGKGDGTFTSVSPGNLASAVTPTLVAGDVNGDHILDLVAFSQSSTINVYLGNGDGTFRNGGEMPFQPENSDLALADFNRDGKLDIVATNNGQESITVFLGNGDGTFSQTGITTSTAQITDEYIRVADFNGDGIPDVAVSTGNWTLPVLLGNGDGTFTITPQVPSTSGVYVFATNIAAADFNGDGRPDIAGLENASNAVSIQLTQPTETASATTSAITLSGPAPHLVDATYPGDSNYTTSTSDTASLLVQATIPMMTPGSGTYTSVQTVTISDATAGATIYYTIDGDIPTTSSQAYSGPITVSEHNETIQAMAVATGYRQSATATVNFTLNIQPPTAPVLSLASGVYANAQIVTITESTPGAAIYYTTNGSVPTASSTKYTGPITVSTSETVVAIAAIGYATSPAVSAQYIISSAATRFMYTIAGNGQFGYSGDGGAATAADINSPEAVVRDAAGNLYVADSLNNVVRKIAAGTGIITTVAGNGTQGHSGDGGAATSAELSGPSGLALDAAGNLYIVDDSNNVVRKVAASNGVISNFAGNGSLANTGDGGVATSAGIGLPFGIAIDAQGNVFVSQLMGYVVRKITAGTGIITTVAGNGRFGYTGDGGPATAAELNYPQGIVVDGAGNLFIADASNNVIRKVNASNGVISTVAGMAYTYNGQQNTYSGDGGPATSATLNAPQGVAVDGAGNLYIADSYNSAIREVTASSGIITTIAGGGSPATCTTLGGDAGPATSSALCSPAGVTVDSQGNLYIADTYNTKIREVTVASTPPSVQTAAPAFNLTAGTYGAPQTVTISDKTPGAAIYLTLDGSKPSTLSQIYNGPINASGNVTIRAVAATPGYLLSAEEAAEYTITSQPAETITTVAGTGVFGFVGGAASSARFGSLGAVARSNTGDLYVTDIGNDVIWKVAVGTDAVSIAAGTGQYGYTGDGGLATSATLGDPQGIAVDAAGNLYISDSGNGVIRKVTASTGVITTVVGVGRASGNPGNIGNGGPATSALLSYPQGIAVDAAGNLYIADSYDNEVREVSAATGIITSVAGNGIDAWGGDGGAATSAWVGTPTAVAVDGTGNLYIATSERLAVRKVTANTGIISTIAGNGEPGTSGDGGPALNAEIYPLGLAVDATGNVYISNSPGSIREVVAATGQVQRFAGNGYYGFSGDGGSATIAEVYLPQGLAFDGADGLYFADAGNYRIRKVAPASVGGQAVAPVFSVAAGTYVTAQVVTITDATPGATVHYTVDGTTPTTGSSAYSAPITIAKSETLKAIATAGGYTQSAVTAAVYAIQPPDTQAITLSPATLTFSSTATGVTSAAQTITIQNTGMGAVTLTSETLAGTSAGSYLISANTCGSSLATGASCSVSVEFKPSVTGTLSASLSVADTAPNSPQTVTLTGTAVAGSGLEFVPITPCRIADTRNATGAFGGPELAAGGTRTVDIPQSACSIPSSAVAYSLNVTVVPDGPLTYLTMWPAGEAQPFVSTLNSDGRVKANAAITPAGTNGGVSIYASNATQVILDIDGYFVPAGTNTSSLEFYPVTPCRVADTRNAAGSLGGPSVPGGASRSFPVQSSSCGIPSTAKAYSLNVTAVPHTTLNYLTAWPTGEVQPNVSTLNSSTGAVTANAAIVQAGTSGDVSIFVSDTSDVILDINGYFAPAGTGGLSLYTATPCRVIDTRSGSGAFNGVLAVDVETSTCAPPSTARTYVLNATVVPSGSLDYLTLWSSGEAQPNVSTLNALDGAITSNMAIVPTTNGSISAFSSGPTNLILDLSSYFAP